MLNAYTDYANECIEYLVETDIASIWADLELLGEETDSERWAAKLNAIAEEYLITSRFALMRILCHRAAVHMEGAGDPRELCYSVAVGQDVLTFRDISMEHARSLSAREHEDYLRYLLDIAGPSPEEDPQLHTRVIFRAWHDEASANLLLRHSLPEEIRQDPKRRRKYEAQIEKESKKLYSSGLTREEALRLGHILKFTLEEMQWYLMRVFDLEDGFRMNRSSDLIEAYCFLTEATCADAEALKNRYSQLSREIQQQEDLPREQNWTRQTAGGLLERVESWKRYPETRDENFLSWLTERASGLDISSRTARRIYRNLAAYAYGGDLPCEEELLSELLHISDMDEASEEAMEHLCSEGEISRAKCQQVAEQLYWENKTITDEQMKDNTKTWSVVTIRKDKELSVSYGAVNSSRTRIQSLLLGTEEVEKSDLLYLLWFTFNLVWSDTQTQDEYVICNRIFDLKDAASAFLDNALLPPFYPPHLMEQSMLLSILYGGKTGTDPSVIYGAVLQSLRAARAGGKKSGKHALGDKIAIITDYRNRPDMTLKQCAEKYGISEQTISRWQKELLEEGLIAPEDTIQ